MIVVKERIYLRTSFKGHTHVRFRDDKWDSSYHIYEDRVRVKYTEKLLKERRGGRRARHRQSV